MLTIKNPRTGEIIRASHTTFPDGTSQVWKIDEAYKKWTYANLYWEYEQEVELIWMYQLVDLVNWSIPIGHIHIPYLPFARQDKPVTNQSTFAKLSFLRMLPNRHMITALDVHSNVGGMIKEVLSYSPVKMIHHAYEAGGYDYVVYPDKGALERYQQDIDGKHPYVHFVKVREPITGKITETRFINNSDHDLTGRRVLIVDDLCDYGGTFVNAANMINSIFKNCKIGLYVTHGLFHGGVEKMLEAGITDFYTSDSLNAYRGGKGISIKELKVIHHHDHFIPLVDPHAKDSNV